MQLERGIADGSVPTVTPSVLVLGAGFIGAAVVRALLDRGCVVRVVTRSGLNERQEALLHGATAFIGDVHEMGTLASALVDIDHVVYAVGSSSPVESDLDPANDIVQTAPPLIRLLELLRLRPNVGLSYLSSGGTVYGDMPLGPIHESAVARPTSSYGIIKLTCETYVSMYADVHGIPGSILRIANVYGPGQAAVRGQGLIARLVRCAVTGEAMPLYGSPETVRDYVYIDDVASGVADLVCTRNVPRILNVGSGVGCSVGDVVALVEEVTGVESIVTLLPARGCDVRANVLDITRLKSVVPFHPVELRSGLERTWKAMLDHQLPPGQPPRFPAGTAR